MLGGSLVVDSEIYWTWANWLREHGPWGKHAFYMGPLYPYSLAAFRALAGDSIPAVLAAQGVLGAAACALLADGARGLAGPAIGLAIGAWAALYEMSVFLDGLVLMESLLFFLECLLLWSLLALPRAPGRGRAWTALGLGVLVGLLAAGRATAALLLPLVAAWVALRPALATPGRWRSAGLVAAGFLLVAAPITLRNRAIAGEWIPFSYNGGLNLYTGNNPEATGAFVVVTGTQLVTSGDEPEGVGYDGREYLRLETGRAFTPAQSSRHWSKLALAWMRENPGRALELAARRLAMMWNRHEYPQVENVAEFRQVAGPIGAPGLGSFVVLGPLALAGLLLVLARRRGGAGGAVVAGYVLAVTVAVLPFFVTDRYRHHLVPGAFLLAAIALGAILVAIRARDARAGGRLAGLVLAGLVVVHLPVPRLSAAKERWGIAADLGARYLERGRNLEAIAQFERALALEPEAGLAGGKDATRALERASMQYNYALALERAGRQDEARTWLRRAAVLAPQNARILDELAALEARLGDRAAADRLESRGDRLVGDDQAGDYARGQIAARAGRLDEARAHFAAAVEAAPANGAAWGALVRVELQAGRAAAAESTLAVAMEAGWRDDAFRLHRALVLAVGGDLAGARAERAAVAPAAIAADPALADVDRLLQRILQRGAP